MTGQDQHNAQDEGQSSMMNQIRSDFSMSYENRMHLLTYSFLVTHFPLRVSCSYATATVPTLSGLQSTSYARLLASASPPRGSNSNPLLFSSRLPSTVAPFLTSSAFHSRHPITLSSFREPTLPRLLSGPSFRFGRNR